MVEITRVSFCSSKWSPVTKLNEKWSIKTKVWWNLSTWIQLENFGRLENRTRREVNSCVAFGNFLPRGCFSLIASRMITVKKNNSQSLPLKFQYATFGSIKISGNEIFTGSLTGSEPEMTIFDRMGDFFESGEVK